MKLQQLLEYQFPEIKTRSVRRSPDQYNLRSEYDKREDVGSDPEGPRPSPPRVMRDPNVHHLGTGSFASVYTHKDRPHDVRKLSRGQEPKKYDGFWEYIKALSKHSDNGNPYFPRFSSITNYVDPKWGSYSVQMERLNHIDSISKREALALMERMFGHNTGYLLKDMKPTGFRISNVIATMFRSENSRRLIVDEDLRKAIEFIKMQDRDRVFVDIHIDNMMVRNTPYGKQLVFSDPLA